jgi:hypothetical protein
LGEYPQVGAARNRAQHLRAWIIANANRRPARANPDARHLERRRRVLARRLSSMFGLGTKRAARDRRALINFAARRSLRPPGARGVTGETTQALATAPRLLQALLELPLGRGDAL